MEIQVGTTKLPSKWADESDTPVAVPVMPFKSSDKFTEKSSDKPSVKSAEKSSDKSSVSAKSPKSKVSNGLQASRWASAPSDSIAEDMTPKTPSKERKTHEPRSGRRHRDDRRLSNDDNDHSLRDEAVDEVKPTRGPKDSREAKPRRKAPEGLAPAADLSDLASRIDLNAGRNAAVTPSTSPSTSDWSPRSSASNKTSRGWDRSGSALSDTSSGSRSSVSDVRSPGRKKEADISNHASERERNRLKKLSSNQPAWRRPDQPVDTPKRSEEPRVSTKHSTERKDHKPLAHKDTTSAPKEPKAPTPKAEPKPSKDTKTMRMEAALKFFEEEKARLASGEVNWADDDDF